MPHFHDGPQLILRHVIPLLAGIHVQGFQDAKGHPVHSHDDRGHEDHQHINDMPEPEGVLLRLQGGNGLWGDFTENQYQKGKDPGSRARGPAAEHFGCKDRKHGRGGQVDHIVANEYGAEHPALVLTQLHDPHGRLIACLGQGPDADLVYSGKGCLR